MRHVASSLLLLLVITGLFAGCSMGPRRVAVMDFENATGSADYDKLKTAVPEYLMQYLSNYDSMHVLERQDIHRFMAEIDSDASDTRRLSRWQKLGQKIHAQYLIAGSCSRLDRNFIITARLFSVEKGQVVPGTASTKTCVNEYEIFDRAKSMAYELAYQLKYRNRDLYQADPSSPQAAQSSAEDTSSALQNADGNASLPDLSHVR